jgi:exopolysaccharide biosynthesis polyprenyl glycosylphosphotransferase
MSLGMPKLLNKLLINKKVLISTLILSDALFTFFAFLIAYFLRNKGIFRHFLDVVQPIEVYFTALPFAILILIIILALTGSYEPKKRRTQISETYTIFKATSIWILLIMTGSYLSKFDYSRIIIVLFYILTLCLIILGRAIARSLHQYLLPHGFGNINILIVGFGRKAREIKKRIEDYRFAGYNFVGFVKNKANLAEIIAKRKIDEVYFADSALSPNQILNIVAKCSGTKAKFKIVSNVFDLITGSVNLANLDSIPSLDLNRANLAWWKAMYKRLFDIVFSIFSLIILLPVMLVIIILIRIDSPGKAIIEQMRVGKDGKLFTIYKFRTMRSRVSLYLKSPTKNRDRRVTRVGRFLRRTSLDELPQLFNVLRGEMSIVGPRPEMPFIVRRYNYWEKRRLVVKPGLTGLWQILGRKDLPLNENLEYDFYYINNQSFFLDLVIILKTIPVVLGSKGAY